MSGGTFYAVDRVEGNVAVLVDDDGNQHDVPRRSLPRDAREGAVLRVSAAADGAPDWSTAVVDDVERRRRLAEARDALERLKRTDPGGDIAI